MRSSSSSPLFFQGQDFPNDALAMIIAIGVGRTYLSYMHDETSRFRKSCTFRSA